MIHAIAAVDDKMGLSKKGVIPWNIPSDKVFYRSKINNHVILMGYHTYETHTRPFGNKPNFVLSNYDSKQDSQFFLVNIRNLPYLLELEEDIWVIGGARTFEIMADYIEKIYLTRVRGDFGCDTFFYDFEKDLELVEEGPASKENGFLYSVDIYKKIT